MFKHKNDEYRVPRREKFFRLLTLLALLVALVVLFEKVTAPVPTVTDEPSSAFGCDDYVLPWDPLESTCRHASLSIL